MEGQHDYNSHPLAPPGTKSIVHEKTGQQGTWAPHGKYGVYVGPAMEHYRCYKCYLPSTGACRISDTVVFIKDKFKIPQVSPQEATSKVAEELIKTLKSPSTHPPVYNLATGTWPG